MASEEAGRVLTLRDALTVNVLGALVVHQIYKKYEIDPSKLGLTALLLGGVPSLSTFLLIRLEDQITTGSIILSILTAFGVYYATLVGAVIFYRLGPFHPLAGYPGPMLPRVSKVYGLMKMASGKNHEWHKKMHEKYGPCVRVGPNELSIVDGDILTSVLGSNGLPKGPMWDARRNPHGVRSLIAIRDMQEHARRRKAWNRAFSTSSLKGYEPILVRRALQLTDMLEKQAGAKGGPQKDAVNLVEWMRYFTFDFMGDMAFGGGFETMRDGTENVGIWHALEGGVKGLAMMQHLPWLLELLYMIPGTTKNVDLLREQSRAAVKRRKQEGSLSKDLFHHLIDEDGMEKEPPTDAEVISDGVLAILAGSDTTATVISGLFYHLLQHAEDYIRLQGEVDQTFPPGEGDATDASKLSEMVFLNAVINEALRINPPANVLQRSTTAETGAKQLGKYYIPEGTAIDFPIYTLFRDPRYFSPAPEEFWPDRWLSTSMRKRAPSSHHSSDTSLANGDVTMNASAFIPFSYGPANCAGRNLALAELRMVVALLIQRFEMRLEEGYDPKDWTEKLEDWFIMQTGKLPVVFTARN
ncbi:hypothetical protein ACEPAH_5465 [Sanghuangporus vaninii]